MFDDCNNELSHMKMIFLDRPSLHSASTIRIVSFSIFGFLWRWHFPIRNKNCLFQKALLSQPGMHYTVLCWVKGSSANAYCGLQGISAKCYWQCFCTFSFSKSLSCAWAYQCILTYFSFFVSIVMMDDSTLFWKSYSSILQRGLF